MACQKSKRRVDPFEASAKKGKDTGEQSSLACTSRSSPERRQSSDFDEGSPGKKRKFDATRHFMLMPNQRREKNLALKRLKSLGKRPTSNLDQLSEDCILQVMHHLPPHRDWRMYHSDLPNDMENFARSTIRVRLLKEKYHGSLHVGVQEKQYPRYQTVFGSPGRQTEKQVQNIRSALATYALLQGAHRYVPGLDLLLQDRIRSPKSYRQQFPTFLSMYEQMIDRQLQLCKSAGFLVPEGKSSLPERTIKDALWILCKMGWRDPVSKKRNKSVSKEKDEWKQLGAFKTNLDVPKVIDLFSQQSEEVQHCIRRILLFLGRKIEIYACFMIENMWRTWSLYGEQCLGLEGQQKTQSFLDIINSNVLAATILCGVENVLEFSMENSLENPSAPWLDVVYVVDTRINEINVLTDIGAYSSPAFARLEQNLHLMDSLKFDIFHHLWKRPIMTRIIGRVFYAISCVDAEQDESLDTFCDTDSMIADHANRALVLKEHLRQVLPQVSSSSGAE